MREGNLKEKARALIALSELRLSPEKHKTYSAQAMDFSGNTHADITYLCGAAVILKDESIIQTAFDRSKKIEDPISKSACMIAIARTHKELDPSVNVIPYLEQCYQSSQEVKYWIGTRLKRDDSHLGAVSRPAERTHFAANIPMSQFEVFLGNEEYDKARAETRKDVFNLYWRVEALCRVAEAEG